MAAARVPSCWNVIPSAHPAFLDARSQPSLSCAQLHKSWKYLTKCKYADTRIHDVCTKAHKYRNTIKTWISQAAWRNLTCGILLPSAPQRHDQWGPRRSAAAPCVQGDRREDWLWKTTGGDGPSVDGQSPSGWDEVHQRGEWAQATTARSLSWWGAFLLEMGSAYCVSFYR